jgi:hypothetical protein
MPGEFGSDRALVPNKKNFDGLGLSRHHRAFYNRGGGVVASHRVNGDLSWHAHA